MKSDGKRSAALPGGWAILHQLGRNGMGVLDSARTDARGNYQLTVTRPDTTVQYVVSSRYAGVGYLSGTVGPGPLLSQRLT